MWRTGSWKSCISGLWKNRNKRKQQELSIRRESGIIYRNIFQGEGGKNPWQRRKN